MTIKILKTCTAPVSNTWECGDVCRCFHIEWKSFELRPDEEWEAVSEPSDNWGNSNVVDIRGLKFKEDYDIIEFP